MNKTIFATTFLLSIVVLTAAVVIGVTPTAFAAGNYLPDPIQNPETGHFYQFIDAPTQSWTSANRAATEYLTHNTIQGHLATITSQSENDFIATLIPDNFNPWIGLTDEGTEGQYRWTNGEPFVYSNWDVNQPDNYNGNEDYVQFRGYSDKWNDNVNSPGPNTGYLVEYTPPDINPVKNPANGHYYAYLNTGDKDSTWWHAKRIAQNYVFNGMQGHLVTITSQSENDFVASLSDDDFRPWIGLTNEVTGEWRWITGEPFNYTHWNIGEPSNTANEYYGEFLASNDTWNNAGTGYFGYNDYNTGYVIEFTPPSPVLNPENGNYYQLVTDPNITWVDAHNTATTSTFNGVYGQLVTITSQSENDFVADLVPDGSRSWIGLIDEGVEGKFIWAQTGEPLDYTNWAYGQPDNSNNEDFVEFLGSNNTWNDLPNDYSNITGYIVEYDIPHLNPDNGHYYEYVSYPDILWTDAHIITGNSMYDGMQGHLVTITSASENDFVADLVPYTSLAWIGLTDALTEGEYEWVYGEPFDYSNWAVNQPNNFNDEDYVGFYGNDDKWYDLKDDSSFITGYVIEYIP